MSQVPLDPEAQLLYNEQLRQQQAQQQAQQQQQQQQVQSQQFVGGSNEIMQWK